MRAVYISHRVGWIHLIRTMLGIAGAPHAVSAVRLIVHCSRCSAQLGGQDPKRAGWSTYIYKYNPPNPLPNPANSLWNGPSLNPAP